MAFQFLKATFSFAYFRQKDDDKFRWNIDYVILYADGC